MHIGDVVNGNSIHKGKLAEVHEKKVKMGVKEGLLSRKRHKDNELSNGEDPMVTSSTVMPTLQHPASPTSSLEMITLMMRCPKGEGEIRHWLELFGMRPNALCEGPQCHFC
nr:hypothetical protein CFP56_74029 [Quercus suber]